MSALDQAIIKAYAKDRPAAASESPVATVGRARPAHGPSCASAVEALYRDGALYRFERVVTTNQVAPRLPAPHLPQLPPTSPRRNVRRSVIKLLAAAATTRGMEAPIEAPPKIARKVIIRHISHTAAPPPLGLLRPTTSNHQATSELPPEEFVEEKPAQPMPAPATPPGPPAVAPQNLVVETASPIEVRGEWLHESALAPMLMLADGLTATRHPAFAQMVVQVDELAAAAALSRAADAREQAEAPASRVPDSFTVKSLDDVDEPRLKFYIDAPHVENRFRPHARFRIDTPTPASDTAEHVDQSSTDIAEVAQVDLPPLAIDDELAFAETFEEAFARDLIPLAEETEPAPSPSEPVANTEKAVQRAIPVWEVDRFHWPKTCEKLLADADGYLSAADGKLLAAVQDGLKVLGITGSRRGEGRSTLSLCLARAAARAGIQVALMDADFARPQLASKLGLETAFGWQDAALGKIPLSEAAIKSLADNITVLALESASAARRLSLADPRVTATIRAAAATFELLILDLGPVSAGDEIAFPAGEACPLDAAIVLRDVRFATAIEAESVGRLFQDLGVEAVGIAENFVIEEEVPATSV